MKTASTTFLPVLATMLLSVCITLSARADRAENAFVKVRAVGADVERVDGRNFSAQGDTEVEIEAQPGWTLLTPSRVRVTKGQSPRYRVKSVSNEDDGHGDIYWTTTEHILRHMEDPTVTAVVSAGGPYVYAAPQDGTNAVLSCSASATPGMHVWETRTTVYKNGAVVSTSASNSDPFPLELDQWSWDWSLGPENGTTNVQSFSTEPIHLSSGTYPAEGTVTASSSQCGDCHATDSVKQTAEVYKLELKTQTDATKPENRGRRTIGVAEKVAISIVPEPPMSFTWSVDDGEKGGSVEPETGKHTKFAAGEVPARATVTAKAGDVSLSVSLSIIAPSIVNQAKIGPDYGASNPCLWAGMQTLVFIGPTSVNFSNLSIHEGSCKSVGTGYYKNNTGEIHPEGKSMKVSESTLPQAPELGWLCYGTDLVAGRTRGPDYSNGTYTWDIPIFYEINGHSYEFIKNKHFQDLVARDKESATLSVSKANSVCSWSCP